METDVEAHSTTLARTDSVFLLWAIVWRIAVAHC